MTGINVLCNNDVQTTKLRIVKTNLASSVPKSVRSRKRGVRLVESKQHS